MIRDLLSVQLDYLETLRAGVNHSMVTFASDETLNSRVFSEERVVLFGTLPDLLKQAESFYEELEACVRTWPSSQPGGLFSKYDWKETFQPYLVNYPRSQNLIDRCSKASKHFQSWVLTSNASTGKNLCETLAAPLVILQQYEHFLENLNPDTPSSHPDHRPLINAYTEMTFLASEVRSAMEKAKNLRDLWQLSERIQGAKELLLLEDSTRAYVHESSVDLILPTPPSAASTSEAPDNEQIRLILLSDQLIEATQKRKLSGRKITFKRKIPLHLANLVDESGLVFRIRIDDEQSTTYTYSALAPTEKTEWVLKIKAVLKLLQRKKIFGIPLEVVMSTPRERFNDIPSLVQQTVDEVVARGLRTEGIFRLSGAASHIRSVRQKLDLGEEVCFKVSNPECADIHVVAGVLKLWIRSLPDPLMTSTASPQFLKIASALTGSGYDEDEIIAQLRTIVHSLPNYNRYLLHHLISFFELISGFSDTNKMSPHNLAIVFAPNLIGTGSTVSIIDPSAHKAIFSLVEFLIENCDAIFEEVAAERRQIKESSLRVQQEKAEFEAQRAQLIQQQELASI